MHRRTVHTTTLLEEDSIVLKTMSFPFSAALYYQGLFAMCEEDKKAMIRNPYNRIPHHALNTKRDTYNQDGTKIKTVQEKSQSDSSFPTIGHKDILNKLNSKSKTNRKRTKIDN